MMTKYRRGMGLFLGICSAAGWGCSPQKPLQPGSSHRDHQVGVDFRTVETVSAELASVELPIQADLTGKWKVSFIWCGDDDDPTGKAPSLTYKLLDRTNHMFFEFEPVTSMGSMLVTNAGIPEKDRDSKECSTRVNFQFHTTSVFAKDSLLIQPTSSSFSDPEGCGNLSFIQRAQRSLRQAAEGAKKKIRINPFSLLWSGVTAGISYLGGEVDFSNPLYWEGPQLLEQIVLGQDGSEAAREILEEYLPQSLNYEFKNIEIEEDDDETDPHGLSLNLYIKNYFGCRSADPTFPAHAHIQLFRDENSSAAGH
jgi:hypothetical protein